MHENSDGNALFFNAVSKSFGKHQVIRDVTLRLQAHKTHIFLGQSGSGKSTLVRLAAGLIAPSSGQVLLRGRPAFDIPHTQKPAIFGYMIQDGGLFPHLTCRRNILLPADVAGLAKEEKESRLLRLCQMVDIEPALIERYPSHISGGQRQRVALVRSLILDPDILFLDEPLGALDPIVRGDLQSSLKRVFNQLKKTVIIVTHDLAEAAYFAHTITLLKDGSVEQHGTLDELLSYPKSEFVSEYFRAQRPPPDLAKWAEKGDA